MLFPILFFRVHKFPEKEYPLIVSVLEEIFNVICIK